MFKTTIASVLVAFAAANNSTTTAGCDQLFTCTGCNANAACGWVKPKTITAAAATRQCKDKVMSTVDENLYEAVANCEACDTNDCTDCYTETGCKFWEVPGLPGFGPSNVACSVEKPTGATSFAWSELTDATCKANAASKSTEKKCQGMKACNTCKTDADCLWYRIKGTDEQQCNTAVLKDDTTWMGPGNTLKEVVDTCPACGFSDCDMCKKAEGCKWVGTKFFKTFQNCHTEARTTEDELDTCPVESPAVSVGISAAALAATALAMLMN